MRFEVEIKFRAEPSMKEALQEAADEEYDGDLSLLMRIISKRYLDKRRTGR